MINKSDAHLDLEEKGLDSDGLASIGKKLEYGDAELCVYDSVQSKPKITSYKDQESARVETVRVMGSESGNQSGASFGYTIRYPRNPVIGDKFSSRHG